jgi:hypothetical protein
VKLQHKILAAVAAAVAALWGIATHMWVLWYIAAGIALLILLRAAR